MTDNEKYEALEKTVLISHERAIQQEIAIRNRIFNACNLFTTIIITVIGFMLANGDKVNLEWLFFWIVPALAVSLYYRLTSETILFIENHDELTGSHRALTYIMAEKAKGTSINVSFTKLEKMSQEALKVTPEKKQKEERAMKINSRGNMIFIKSLQAFIILLTFEGLTQIPYAKILEWIYKVGETINFINHLPS